MTPNSYILLLLNASAGRDLASLPRVLASATRTSRLRILEGYYRRGLIAIGLSVPFQVALHKSSLKHSTTRASGKRKQPPTQSLRGLAHLQAASTDS